jgi:RNA polymerase sigma-70 factor (ECF subfamily)
MDETLPKLPRGFSFKRKPGAAGADEAVRAGQFEAVFLEHWPQVYHLLANLTGSPDEAEDLALETFLRLHNHPLADGQNPGGWLRRVAINLGLDALRRGKRRERYELEAGRLDLQEPPAGPAELLAQKEERRHVRRVLAGMKPRSAQILILRYSGLSYSEIAQALGVAPASIGPLLVRAENEFRKRYREEDEEE